MVKQIVTYVIEHDIDEPLLIQAGMEIPEGELLMACFGNALDEKEEE